MEKKYLELQHRYRTLQRKMATLEDKSKEVEFLKSHVLQQESVMKQLQLMIATGSISGMPAKSWGNSGKVFPTNPNPKTETSESGGDMAKRLDKLEGLIEVGVLSLLLKYPAFIAAFSRNCSSKTLL